MDVEERLRKAASSCANAQQLCEGYQREAKQYLKQCANTGAKIQQAEGLLQTLQGANMHQLQLLIEMFTTMKTNYVAVKNKVRAHTERKRDSDQRLVRVCQQLKSQVIDVGLMSSEGENQTLFHSVDTNSIDTLSDMLQKNINSLLHKQEIIKLSLEHLEGRVDEVKELIKVSLDENAFIRGLLKYAHNQTKLDASLSSKLVDHTKEQIEGELGSITSILVSVTSLTDRVEATLHRWSRSGLSEFANTQLVALEGTVSQLPSYVAKATECLNRAKEQAESLVMQSKECERPFQRCNQIKECFDRLSYVLYTTNAKLIAYEKFYEEIQPSAQFYLDEMDNLVLWYSSYYIGYHELIFEIQRRRAEHNRQQQFLNIVNKELEIMYKEEQEKRDKFAEGHAKFLPNSLCPAINEECTRYQLQMQPTALPTLSKEYKRANQEQLASLIFDDNLNKK